MDKEMVSKVIEEKIRPALQSHGGDIELVEIKGNKIFVKLVGACGCCPHAQMTMQQGVEQILKSEIPEIEEVLAV